MCLALLGPGDTASVPAPSFRSTSTPSPWPRRTSSRPGRAGLAGASWRTWRGSAESSSSPAQDPRPQLSAQPDRHGRGSGDFFEEVVALAESAHFFVINDFAYGDIWLRWLAGPELPLRAGRPRTLGCEFTTMSRGYNMAGWRVGFAAGNRQMLNAPPALKAIKGYYDYGIFQAVQIAAIVALRHGEPGQPLAQVAEYQMRAAAACWSMA